VLDLNIKFVFEDALRLLTHPGKLQSCALPILLFHMQGDVINSYRQAMDHYLTTPLDSAFLQNSSLGSPYQKWLTITNSDFDILNFCTYNLLRYTSRLRYEIANQARICQGVEYRTTVGQEPYTDLIFDHRYGRGSIGYRVFQDHILSFTCFPRGEPRKVIGKRASTGDFRYFAIEIVDGMEKEIPTDTTNPFPLVEERINIRDRSILNKIRENGHLEILQLTLLHEKFGDACRETAKENDPLRACK
jgi:hypothetical protein